MKQQIQWTYNFALLWFVFWIKHVNLLPCCHSEHGWVAVRMKTESMIKCTTSQVDKFANSKQILTSKFLIKGIPLPHCFGYEPLWQQYKHFTEILRLYHYDNDCKFLPKSLHTKVYKENLTVTLCSTGLERSRQCKGNTAAMRAGKRDKGAAAFLPHVSSVCYQPKFPQGLLFLCYQPLK